jgi:hypothetical protein
MTSLPAVGTIVNGTRLKSIIKIRDNLQLELDALGQFKNVQIQRN